MKPLLRRNVTNKQYTTSTKADEVFNQMVKNGIDKKMAAKQAQALTGLSLITGRRMKTKGF